MGGGALLHISHANTDKYVHIYVLHLTLQFERWYEVTEAAVEDCVSAHYYYAEIFSPGSS